MKLKRPHECNLKKRVKHPNGTYRCRRCNKDITLEILNIKSMPKCEMCGEELTADNTQTSDNSKRCDDCYEEWGDQWADK